MLPNLIVIGAMKSATSSLHYYLGLHPQISMSKVKELDFFISQRNWKNGIKWYESNFDVDSDISGESSPNYTKYPGFIDVPERMYSVLPTAKLIYVLRDPVQRIVSHYIHNVSQATEKRSISEALNDLEHNHYIYCSKYFLQINRYLEFYHRDKILIMTAEDLRNNRQSTLQNVFRFLGVDDQFYCQEYSLILHQSFEKKRKNWLGLLLSRLSVSHKIQMALPSSALKLCRLISGTEIKKPELNEKLRSELIEILKDDVGALREFTGMEFKNWCL